METLQTRARRRVGILPCTGLQVFPHGSAVALVTELLETDLADVIRSSKRALTESQAKAYLQMLLHALQHCHKHRVIHRCRSTCLSSAQPLSTPLFLLVSIWAQAAVPVQGPLVRIRFFWPP